MREVTTDKIARRLARQLRKNNEKPANVSRGVWRAASQREALKQVRSRVIDYRTAQNAAAE